MEWHHVQPRFKFQESRDHIAKADKAYCEKDIFFQTIVDSLISQIVDIKPKVHGLKVKIYILS